VSIVEGAAVRSVVIDSSRATGVVVRQGVRSEFMEAELVVLRASGIEAHPTLFVDPVLCVAARWEGAGLDRQLPMPFVSEQEGYILSPYFDWLSFFFNKGWRRPRPNLCTMTCCPTISA
jgi:hypothetical protein